MLYRIFGVTVLILALLAGVELVRGEELPNVQWGLVANPAEAKDAINIFNNAGLSPKLNVFYDGKSLAVKNAARGYYALLLEDGWPVGTATIQHIIETIPATTPEGITTRTVKDRVIIRKLELTDMTATLTKARVKSPDALIADCCRCFWGQEAHVISDVTKESLIVTGADICSLMRADRRYGFKMTTKGGFVWGLQVIVP